VGSYERPTKKLTVYQKIYARADNRGKGRERLESWGQKDVKNILEENRLFSG
jgi:hypothetical protein